MRCSQKWRRIGGRDGSDYYNKLKAEVVSEDTTFTGDAVVVLLLYRKPYVQ